MQGPSAAAVLEIHRHMEPVSTGIFQTDVDLKVTEALEVSYMLRKQGLAASISQEQPVNF